MSTDIYSGLPFPSVTVAQVPFAVTSLDSAVQWLLEDAAPQRLAINIRLANAYTVSIAQGDPNYRELLISQGLNFPDGTPVVWFMNRGRAAGAASRVRGPSFFDRVMKASEDSGLSHFLLGSTEPTLDLLQKNLHQRYPKTRLAGAFSPPFSPLNDAYVEECARQVERSGADVVWVGLGTPKQDFLGSALARRLAMPTINVGAAFDFQAGTVREAPSFIQNSGFEWLYRLGSEPRRLWKRYTLGNAKFLLAALRNPDK